MTNKNKNPSMPDMGYVDLLDHSLTENEKNSTFTYYPLRPSSAGKCSLALYYDLKEFNGDSSIVRPLKEPNVIRLLSLGHSIEYSMIGNFYKMCKEFGYSIKYKQQVVTVFTLDDGHIVQGSTDFCLEHTELGHKCIADAKSMKDAFHVFRKTRFDDTLKKYSKMKSLKKLSELCFYAENVDALVEEFGDDFKIDNLMQLNSYACADFFVERGYDHASLFYYNKNDSRMFELRFKPSTTLRDKVKDKYQKVYDAKESTDVPRDYRLGSIRCAFCDYNSICHSNANPLVAWFETLPKKQFATFISKVKKKAEIKKLFTKFDKLEINIAERKKIEDNICDLLSEQEVSKVKLDNGDVYEVRLLKSPKPHLVLRRSK